MSIKYATVDEIIEIFQKISDEGRGSYVVGCNMEYYLAKVGEMPDIDDKLKTIDLGGYIRND